MGYGGLINTAVDPFGLGATAGPNTPKPGKVGADYLQLVQAFMKGAPDIFGIEQQFKPQYLGLNTSLFSEAMAGINNANPTETGLLGTLGQQAREGLDAGANLDPGLANVAQQSLRGGQAARGLGYGPGDAMDEAFQMTGLGNQLRQQRQGFASNVVGMENQFRTAPAIGLVTGGSSSPSIIPGQQNYDMFNTAYNARAAANIAGANNAAASANSY